MILASLLMSISMYVMDSESRLMGFVYIMDNKMQKELVGDSRSIIRGGSRMTVSIPCRYRLRFPSGHNPSGHTKRDVKWSNNHPYQPSTENICIVVTTKGLCKRAIYYIIYSKSQVRYH